MKIFANGKTRGHVLRQTKEAQGWNPEQGHPQDNPLDVRNEEGGGGYGGGGPDRQSALRELQDCVKMMGQIQETLSKNARFARTDPEVREQISLLLRAIKGLQIEPEISELAEGIGGPGDAQYDRLVDVYRSSVNKREEPQQPQ